MTAPSSTDTTDIRQTLAELRARLDQQQALILDGFASLRQEIDALDAQVRQLATEAVQPVVEPVAAPVAPVAQPAEAPVEATEAEPSVAQPIPVGTPVSSDVQDIPVGTAVSPQPGQSPPSPDFNFGQAEPKVEATAEQFDFDPPQATEAPAAAAAQPQPSQDPVVAAAHMAAASGEELDMEQIIFGPELAANQSLYNDRQALLHGLYSGNHEAMTLIGHILIFRGASADRMPGLLKEVGESYYRWRPQTATADDYFRDELTGWLQRKCDEAGVPNAIELVRPGDRYDSKRHHSKDRGIEVDQVQGWVVLRDNGKVYTKAAVTLK